MLQSSELIRRLGLKTIKIREYWRLFQYSRKVAAHAHPRQDMPRVAIFNASTRIWGMSLNAAFSLLSSWGLQLSGVPVVHFVCRAGMSRCVLGTNPNDHTELPPCQACIAQSDRLYAAAPKRWFTGERDERLSEVLNELSLDQLEGFEYPLSERRIRLIIPLGRLVLPSLRWVLRRHDLSDDEPTRFLYREYILSAFRVAQEFQTFLDELEPEVVVIFNGLQYPEATARWLARERGLRVVTHEVGFQPFSAFFSHGDATAYPIHIPEDFKLTPEQNTLLDNHLSERFHGNFTMAGINFWPEIHGLDEGLLEHADHFRQVVPVFTNVIFDTSQVHANVVFPHMFAWLDQVLDIIHAHPETLFVIRAHPDEKRPGSRKQSRESVSDWVVQKQVDLVPNVIFIDSLEYLNSYNLIQRAKFVMVYNSSIGLEATLLGTPVLCGGKARYTQYPTVYFPRTPDAYREKADTFLAAERLEVPPEHLENARRFLYYQFFKVSLPFGKYLNNHPTKGFVQFKRFSWRDLLPERSPTIQTVLNGVVRGESFVLMDDEPLL